MKSYSVKVEPAQHSAPDRSDLNIEHYDFVKAFLHFRNVCQELDAVCVPPLDDIKEENIFVDARMHNIFLTINE